MARGSIRKRQVDNNGVRYDVVVDLGTDPVTGQRRQRKKTFATRMEAQAGLAAWLAEIDKGTAVDRSVQTVGELLEYWLANYAQHRVSPRTFDGYAATVRRHIIPTLGAIPIQKLTPARVQAFYREKLTAGCGARTVELCHLHLSQALDQALKLGWVARNVVAAVTTPRRTARKMETWSADEARRFLAAAQASAYGPIWLLALATGMRKGELLGLRWQDVDAARGVLRVRQTVGTRHGRVEIKPPKTATSRREVFLTEETLAALQEHRARQEARRAELGALWEDHDLVFAAATGAPIHPDNLDRDFDRLVMRAGAKTIRIHDLRHTFATLRSCR